MRSNFRTAGCRRLWGPLAAIVQGCILAASLAQPVQAQGVRPATIASGLDHPWAVAFLPQGRYLVTERPGRMRVVSPEGRIGPALAGVPAVAAGGQGGLLDLALDSGFSDNRTLYFCFSEAAKAAAEPRWREPAWRGTSADSRTCG